MAATPLDNLADELARLKGAGHTAVALDALIRYVSDLVRSAPTDPETERQRIRLDFETRVERYRAKHGSDLEMFKAVLEAGQTALKTLSLVNGAAAVAILSFIGATLSNQSPIALAAIHGMKAAMCSFAVGVGFAALGFALRYFSQSTYGGELSASQESARAWGDRLRYAAATCGVASLVAFFYGVFLAYDAIPL